MIRIFDIIISILTLLTLSPIIFLISFYILLINGRPIIFKQIRVGLNGKEFIIFKFRTMNNFNHQDEIVRLTNFGKLLRKASLDELPQLFNVLKKDMSIVGPRPLPKNIENKIKLNFRKKRRKILPGITGLSQVNYSGNKRKLNEKVKLDLEYIDNYSVYNYLKILIKTPLVLIIRLFKNKSSIIK